MILYKKKNVKLCINLYPWVAVNQRFLFSSFGLSNFSYNKHIVLIIKKLRKTLAMTIDLKSNDLSGPTEKT